MKKKILLFALVAIMAFSAIGASASSLKSFSPSNDSYKVTYNVGAENATAQYGMIVVKGTTPDTWEMDEILYIGQAAADENGNITFTDFAPMGPAPSDYEEGAEGDDGDGKYFEECTVFIGGEGIDGNAELEGSQAQAIGILKDGSGVIVSGKVIDTFSNRKATVSISGNGVDASVETEDDGTFSIKVAAGTDYTVKFLKEAYLTRTYTGVDVTAGVELGNVDITNCAGDVTGNGIVEFPDLQEVLAIYNENSETTADINGNGIVEFPDLQAILASYNEANADRTSAYTAQ